MKEEQFFELINLCKTYGENGKIDIDWASYANEDDIIEMPYDAGKIISVSVKNDNYIIVEYNSKGVIFDETISLESADEQWLDYIIYQIHNYVTEEDAEWEERFLRIDD